MSSVKKNFIYNLIYQILILFIPLITAPYLSRVVGVEGVGIYSYTYSIIYYFMLLCLLGLNNYGNRSIAKVSDNIKKRSKTFWSIYLFQFFMGIIMLILYLGYLIIFKNEYYKIALLQLPFLISSILDINWFFFGMEDFKATITRNSFVKLFSLILIFIMVKNTGDLWKYTLIMSGTTLFSQILMWSFLRKKISFEKITFNDVKMHIKPNLILFIPVIAVSLYKIMDKIMLGLLSNVSEVGFYENAEKISHVPITIISALGTVMLPRISNILSKGNNEEVKKYIEKSISFVMFMSFAMMFGLMAIGYDFSPLYYGKGFEKTGILIMMLSITLPFLSFANVIRTQYLIPKEKDKIYIISVSIGAITNLTLNLIFIPMFESIGACIGTIFAEIFVMLYQIVSIRNELPIKKYIKNTFVFFIKSFLMFICIYWIRFININKFLIIVLETFLGLIIYSLLNINFIKKNINFSKLKQKNRL